MDLVHTLFPISPICPIKLHFRIVNRSIFIFSLLLENLTPQKRIDTTLISTSNCVFRHHARGERPQRAPTTPIMCVQSGRRFEQTPRALSVSPTKQNQSPLRGHKTKQNPNPLRGLGERVVSSRSWISVRIGIVAYRASVRDLVLGGRKTMGEARSARSERTDTERRRGRCRDAPRAACRITYGGVGPGCIHTHLEQSTS